MMMALRKSTVRPWASVSLPVLQDLQQDVEHVGMGLLDLVEQHHRVGPAAHRLGQLAALVVAHVAGRRTHQTADRVLLHELRHVHLDERRLVAEEELGQGAGQLGLAHARRAQEDERAGRTVRVFETGTRTADGPRHGLDRLVLAHHALVQSFLHAQQPVRLGLGELGHRDAGPHGRDLGDLVLADGDLGRLVGLAPLLLQLVPLVEQLALAVAQRGGLLEVLDLDGRLFLPPHLEDGVLHLSQVGGGAHVLDALARRGFVDQVDGLVGQEAVADVAVGQVGRGFEGLVGDAHPVMGLVALAQTGQDLLRLGNAGLLDQDLLETALESGVLGQMLAVLVEGGGPDGLQLAPGQGRLEDGSRVDGAFGRARAHQVVDLVDEQDDVAPFADLLHDLLRAAPRTRPGTSTRPPARPGRGCRSACP